MTQDSGLGLLEAVVGEGFTVALHDGLRRAAAERTLRLAGDDPRRLAPPRSERTKPVRAAARPAVQHPSPSPPLALADNAAVLRRFEQLLAERRPVGSTGSTGSTGSDLAPVAVGSSPGEPPLLLTSFAHHVLRTAEAGTPPEPGETPRDISAAEATALLIESALAEQRDGDPTDDTGALDRAISLTRALADGVAAANLGDGPDQLWRERRRLARELHDGVSAPLAAALSRLESPGERPEAAAAGLAACLRETLDSVTDLVGTLRLHTELRPFDEAVRDFARQEAPDGLRMTVRSTGDELAVPGSWRREVLLTVRECLRNVFTHADATHVVVVSRVTRQWLFVRVEDDGTGFDPESPTVHARQGLRSMRERMEDIGGRLSVESAHGSGTRIGIHLPLPRRR
ncbi:sensor histidine kinase [Streptomyces sp. NPDC015346]|uniref:sensor histidine kinase n=1 Tax=Streptomyces sp. NPDC015346 TaxID=3364954 RepID=UPI003702B821